MQKWGTVCNLEVMVRFVGGRVTERYGKTGILLNKKLSAARRSDFVR